MSNTNTRFFTVIRDRRTLPALTDAEHAEILARKKVTKCPTVRVATTFRQQLSRTA